jgi:hypothetical protein
MTDQKLAGLYRAANDAPALDAQAEEALAAALLGGDRAQREAGLELLGRLPQGPALARLLAAIGPESERLEADLQARRRTRRPWRQLPAALAMAAGVAAVAVMVVSLDRQQAPEQAAVAAPAGISADRADPGRILVASFEAEGNDSPASALPADAEKHIFRGAFDS